MRYDGSAHISPYQGGKKFRVWIEAPNVTAEVYISRAKAREILNGLSHDLSAGVSSSEPTKEGEQ